MQIVIDIDDETYNDIKKGKIYSSFRDVPLESVNAIANGTPLPPHGRLIDADKLKGRSDVVNTAYGGYVEVVRVDDLDYAPIIIEADKESEEQE